MNDNQLLDNFKNISPPSVQFKHFPVLDGVRGIAILTVLAFHLQLIAPGAYWLLKGGFLGVDIFFVLSGFLITSILLKEYDRAGRIDLKNFYIRRFFRLAPAFWVFLITLYFFAPYLLPPEAVEATFGKNNFIYSFLYVLNWHIAWSGQMAGNLNHTWSLAIEEQFYIIWALGLFTMFRYKGSRRPITWFTVGIVLLIIIWRAVRAIWGSTTDTLYYSTDTRIDALLIGCIASMIYCWQLVPEKAFNSAKFNILTVAALISGTLIFFTFSDQDISFYYGFGSLFAASTAIVILWFMTRQGTVLHAILELKALRWLGLVSYGVYLWHYVAFEFAKMVFATRTLRLLAGMALALLVPAISFYFIERPFLKLKGRFSASGSQA